MNCFLVLHVVLDMSGDFLLFTVVGHHYIFLGYSAHLFSFGNFFCSFLFELLLKEIIVALNFHLFSLLFLLEPVLLKLNLKVTLIMVSTMELLLLFLRSEHLNPPMLMHHLQLLLFTLKSVLLLIKFLVRQ